MYIKKKKKAKMKTTKKPTSVYLGEFFFGRKNGNYTLTYIGLCTEEYQLCFMT